MSNSNGNKIMVPNAREAMNKFKMEAANDFHVPMPSYKRGKRLLANYDEILLI